MGNLKTVTGIDVCELDNTDLFKLIITFNNGDLEFLNPVAQFVNECFEKRKQYLLPI